MADTTVITFNFDDTAAKDDFWQTICDKYLLPYTTAAEAEAAGIAEIKSQNKQAFANQKAVVMGDAAKDPEYDAQILAMAGL